MCLFGEEVKKQVSDVCSCNREMVFKASLWWLLYLEGGVGGSWPHTH